MKIITAFVSLNSILTVKIFLPTDINKKKSVKLQKKKTPTSAKTNTNDVKNNGNIWWTYIYFIMKS